MTDAEKVCAALREQAQVHTGHAGDMGTGDEQDRFTAGMLRKSAAVEHALADFVEAAQEMRDSYKLVLGGTRYDAALKRLAEVLL